MSAGQLIVDVHTHLWSEEHWSQDTLAEAGRMRPGEKVKMASPDDHLAAMAVVDKAIVMPIQAAQLGWHVPNDYIHDYVSKHKDKLIGFMGLDPTCPDVVTELERCYYELHLRGIKLSAPYQNVAPLDKRFDPIYRFAETQCLPIVLHSGAVPFRKARLRYANPLLYDEVALRYPELTLVIAHLGHPWGEDAMVLVRKHPHVYADISALAPRPWQLYNFLVMACEWGILPKLLFGSDYPIVTPDETLRALRAVNGMVSGTSLPRIPGDEIESLIKRDSLQLLGIDQHE